MKPIFTLALVLLLCVGIGAAQDVPVRTGVEPYASFFNGGIDHIDLATGAIYGSVPLVSFKQRGRLPSLAFFIRLNTPAFMSENTCDFSRDICYLYYQIPDYSEIAPPIPIAGANIGSSINQFTFSDLNSTWFSAAYVAVPTDGSCDRMVQVCNPIAGSPTTIPDDGECDYPAVCQFYQSMLHNMSITDETGKSHKMYSDTTNLSRYRSADGSGYTIFTQTSDPRDQMVIRPEAIFDSSGIKYTQLAPESLDPIDQISDPIGNIIQRSVSTRRWTDSIGRLIDDPTSFSLLESCMSNCWSGGTSQITPDQAGCPNLADPSQPAISALSWKVPGPGGLLETYIVCYTQFKYHTGFAYPLSGETDSTTYPAIRWNTPSMSDPYQAGPETGLLVNTVGMATFVQSVGLPNGKWWKFHYDASTSTQNGTDVISSEAYASLMRIELPTGGAVSFEYQTIIRSPIDANHTTVQAFRGVTKRIEEDGLGGIRNTFFEYSNGPEPHTYITDVHGDDGKYTRHTFSDLSTVGEHNQLYETKTDTYDGAITGLPIQSTASNFVYQAESVSPLDQTFTGPFITNVREVSSSLFQDGVLVRDERLHYPALPSTGLLICKLLSTDPCSGPTTSALFETPDEHFTYGADGTLLRDIKTSFGWTTNGDFLGANLLSLIGAVQTLDSNGGVQAEIRNGYDEDGSPAGVYGNLTSTTVKVDDLGTYISTKTVFNTNGMPKSSEDVNRNKTEYEYDNTGLFLSSITRPITNGTPHISYMHYDPYVDQVIWSTAEGGSGPEDPALTYRYQYDWAGRLTDTLEPPTAQGQGETQVCFQDSGDCGADHSLAVVVSKRQSATVWEKTETDYDGIGRTVSSKRFDGNAAPIQVDSKYDQLGRLYTVTNPYRLGGAQPITTFDYDNLGRIRHELAPGEAVSLETKYSGLETQVIDEASHAIWEERDGLGQLIDVYEPDETGSKSLHTHYDFTWRGELRHVGQYGKNDVARERNFAYDFASRLIESSNPETGDISYKYLDVNNNLCAGNPSNPCSRTDARGVTTSYVYDALNRLTHKSYSDGTAQQVYAYDGYDQSGNLIGGIYSQNATGRLSATSGQFHVSSLYAYDAIGRLTQKDDCMASDCGGTTLEYASYDLAGNLTSMTYPDGRVINQGFDTAGRLNCVTLGTPDTSCVGGYLKVSAGGYDPAGHLTSATFGNGVAFSAAYDNRQRVQGLGYGTAATNTPLWMRAYNWTPNNNLGNYVDGLTNVERQFSYDNLNRLTGAQDTFLGSATRGYTASNGGLLADGGGVNLTPGVNGAAPQWTNPDDSNILPDGDTPTVNTWIYGAAGALNSAGAPDGTMTARTMTSTSGDDCAGDFVSSPYLYDGHTMTASVWLRSPSGPQTINIYIMNFYTLDSGGTGWGPAGWQALSLTTSWQQFTVTGTVQNQLTALSFQIGGGNSFPTGHSVEMWNPMMEDSGIAGTSVTNFLPYSQRPTAPSWRSAQSSIVENAAVAPDGTNTAAAVTITGDSASFNDDAPNMAPAIGAGVTATLWMKSVSGLALTISLMEHTSSGWGSLNGQTVILTGDWQRFEIDGGTTEAGGQLSLQIDGGGPSANGQTIYIWGAQMELAPSGAFGPYVPTAAVPVTRGTSLTNLLSYSQTFSNNVWTRRESAITGTVPAPDGTNSASEITSSGDNAQLEENVPNAGLYDGQTVTASVYLRVPSGTQTFQLRLHAIAGGVDQPISSTTVTLNTSWQRFSLTAPLPSNMVGLFWDIGDAFTWTSGEAVDVWGAQIEASPHAGPYVATSALPVIAGKELFNLLPNSDMAGPTWGGPGWQTAGGAALALASDTAPDGSHTAVTATSDPTSVDAYVERNVPNPSLYDGQTVTASVYLRSTTGATSLNLYIVQSGDDGWDQTTITKTIALTPNWQRYELTGTLQNGLNQLYFFMGGGSSFASGATFELWGTEFNVGSTAAPYTSTDTSATQADGYPAMLIPAGLNEAYAYDSFGNILQNGSFTAAYTNKNQIVGWPYDAAGNVLTTGYQPIVWDGENRVSTVGGASYFYDGEGNRVEKQGVGVVDTVYFGGRPIARRENGQWTDLIYGPTGLLAEVPQVPTGSAEAPVYRMTDHLGTIIGSLDSTGAFINPTDYAPFGKTIAGGTADPYQFTGKERDAESGLDYFGARYYASSMGRWMSPDWSAKEDPVPYAKLDDPQSLNLYGYVLNNPLSHTDSDGHQCDWCQAFGRGVGDSTLVPLWYAVHHPIDTGVATAKALFTPGLGNAIGNTLEAAKHGDAYALGQLTGVGISAYVMSGLKMSPAAAAANASAGETLMALAQNASASVADGANASVTGTLVHSEFAAQIRALNNPNIGAEVSYLNGEVVPYGTKGSVRLDAVVGPLNNPTAVFDLKTGNAGLTASRINQIRANLPQSSAGVPVQEIRVQR